MTTLDHTAYPYIMDQVIKYASTQALFKLRLTSKSFRARVDHTLATHVFLDSDVVEKNQIKTTMLLPKIYPEPGPSSWALDMPASTVRVLDVERKVLGDARLANTFSAFTAVKTVRRFWSLYDKGSDISHHPSSASTVVDFIPNTKVSLTQPIALSTASRHVVHLRSYDGTVETLFVNTGDVALNDVVLVMWPSTSIQEEWFGYWSGALNAVMSILHACPRQLIVVGFGQTSTVTGSSQSFSKPDGAFGYRVFVKVAQQIRDNLSKDVELKFRTVEEWWAELEEGEKGLIGVWPSEYYNDGMFDDGGSLV